MPPKVVTKKKGPEEFILVKWLADNSIGVMPQSAVHREDEVIKGQTVRVKWGSKFFSAQTLQLSSKLLLFFLYCFGGPLCIRN